MRVVFMGTPDFSAAILEELCEQHEVVAVYTRPDAVRARGNALVPSPVKEVALRLNLPVLTPKTLRDEEVQSELSRMAPDVICVAAYGALLPAQVLEIPRYCCLNVHASLLPRWRGAAPVERAILAGDSEAGVCIMRMEEGLDTGPYCICRETPILDKTSVELTDELAALGANALLSALVHVEAGKASWISQDESQVTYAHKIEKGELDLNPRMPAIDNVRRIQASSDTHSARCVIAKRGVRVLRARYVDDESTQQLVSDLEAGRARFVSKRLFLGCASGALEILKVKPDGKKEMDARAFAGGVQDLRAGDVIWETRHV